MLIASEVMQGNQLVVYGGEKGGPEKADRPEAQVDDSTDDDDEDSEPISDVCQLCPQSHYWVILPMEGERNSKLPARTGSTMTAMPDGRGLVFGDHTCTLSCIHNLCNACWLP